MNCNYCFSSGVHPRKSDGIFTYCRHCPEGVLLGRTKGDMGAPLKIYSEKATIKIKNEVENEHFGKITADLCHGCKSIMTPFYKELESGILTKVPSYFCLNSKCQLGTTEGSMIWAGWRKK